MSRSFRIGVLFTSTVLATALVGATTARAAVVEPLGETATISAPLGYSANRDVGTRTICQNAF